MPRLRLPMPELPEVETFKRYLDSTSLHQRITGVDVRDAYVLKRVSAHQLARRLKGRRFENSHRHGKHLFVRSGDELWLRLHFGMTGWLQYFKRDEETPKTARVLFSFANSRRLAFDDQRKFGEIELIKDMDEFLQRRCIGPDALQLDLLEFKIIFRKYRGAVKAILLNQRLIAGIGNLYADEILFRACIHPATEAASLSDKHLRRLFRATRYVLDKAIALKTDFNRLPKSWLLKHRGKRGRCPRCSRALKSATIGGRTSWFCAHCQKRR
jgi:formamidopyrimidine-DNA glycosylase